MKVNTTLVLDNTIPLTINAAVEIESGDIRLILPKAEYQRLSELAGFPVCTVVVTEYDLYFTLIAERRGAHKLSMPDYEASSKCFRISNQADVAKLYALVTGANAREC